MFLLLSGILFAVYVANVVLGAFASSPFMDDVGEMIVLFAASIAFTVAILKAEREKKKNLDRN